MAQDKITPKTRIKVEVAHECLECGNTFQSDGLDRCPNCGGDEIEELEIIEGVEEENRLQRVELYENYMPDYFYIISAMS